MPEAAMKWGNFAPIAPMYSARAPHSKDVLKCISALVPEEDGTIRIADIGSGTGNLLRSLSSLNVSGYAVEPTPEMRDEAHRQLAGDTIVDRMEWVGGTAENTGLTDSCVSWALMGNLLQWVDRPRAFQEARRILKDDGFLTISWNVRDYEKDPVQQRVEDTIRGIVPDLYRTEAGLDEIMGGIQTLGKFTEWMYVEQSYRHRLSADRFFDTWQGVNEIPSQVDEKTWNRVLEAIKGAIPGESEIDTVWITRAWTYKCM